MLTLLECSSCAHLEKEAKDSQPVGFIHGVGQAAVAARVVHQVHLQSAKRVTYTLYHTKREIILNMYTYVVVIHVFILIM